MNDSVWFRARALFLRSLEQPADERAAFVRRESGSDLALLEQVEQLLEGHEVDASLLDRPAALALRGSSNLTRDNGCDLEQIGNYRLLEQVGVGGFGVVYLAEQLQPIQRRVALKLIHAGLNLDEYVRRFEAERQALALMNHANVAKVFDAGTTDDGARPYFVMEYVEGPSLTDYCDHERLTTRERLELMIQVCDGVHHAHQKGIIHRDLKPSNVLVATESERPVPKIIDFGIAKALGARLTEGTLHTELGKVIGTPEYMSPEQADGASDDIDTRSDLYSLGVLLYELLVGRRPLDIGGMRDAGYAAIQRAILEQEPERPSTRVEAIDDASAAGFRRTETRSWVRELRGDLDWIVMKALEKDRSRRYASVAEFAADLERHLNNEPVSAGPPGARYRAGKFCRKHRGVMTAGVFALLAVVVGFAGLIWANYEIGLERDAARRLSRELLGLSDTKRLDKAVQAARALRSLTAGLAPSLQAWLTEHGRPLVSRLEEHERVLAGLRQNAGEWTEQEQALDRSDEANAVELTQAKAQRSKLISQLDALEEGESTAKEPPVGGSERLRQTLLEERDRLTRQIERLESPPGRRSYTFRGATGEPDGDAQWEHDTRAELVAGLRRFEAGDRFGNGFGSVEWRLREIDRLERETVTGASAESRWQACIQDIAVDVEIYGGLQLEKQFGLLPLDRNPRTKLWEFVHLATGAEPVSNPEWTPVVTDQTERRQYNRWSITNDTGIVLVLIPGGAFTIGAKRPSLEVEFETGTMVVSAVPERSFGEQLGLAIGDRVLAIDGVSISDADTMRAALAEGRSGDTVTVRVQRGGGEGAVEIDCAAVLPASHYDRRAELNESPVTEVVLRPFFLAKYEVTQGQWRRMANHDPAYINPTEYPRYTSRLNPVEQVSWSDAHRVLGEVGLNLPTEAQWEAASRAGSDRPYGFGDRLSPTNSNIAGASYRRVYDRPKYGHQDWDDGFGAHAPVGSLMANPFGVHDMHGNVWEWCRDDFSDYRVVPDEGTGRRRDSSARTKIFRGGSFNDPDFISRSSYRNHSQPEFRFNAIGVRASIDMKR